MVVGNDDKILKLEGITKTFPGVIANDNIDFDIKPGEIHALLGENGAGKSTLMNILYGLYHPDKGSIYIKCEKVKINSPKDAIDLGLGMIHQELRLSPKFKVYENVILGDEPSSNGVLNQNEAKKEIRELSEKYNLDIDPDDKVSDLSIGEKQKVELLKALYQGADILIMDEPTASLTPEDKREFLRLTKKMAEEKKAVIPFITHKLPEVFEISDRVTILKDGRVVDTMDIGQATKEDLARKMVGREEVFQVKDVPTEAGEEVINVENIKALGEKGNLALKGVSFSVRSGEILGIAGVSGNGQRELSEVLTGLREITKGKILFKGEEMTNKKPKDLIDAGIGHIPEDRSQGIMPEFTLYENIFLNLYYNKDYLRSKSYTANKKVLIDFKKLKNITKELMKVYDIKAPSPDTKAGKLSGGNQQKLILDRVLHQSPDLILADKPTRGLDVGAQESIRNKLLEAKGDGKAILLISEDLDELLHLCDRIAVIYEGNIVDTLKEEKFNKDLIGELMTGKDVKNSSIQ